MADLYVQATLRGDPLADAVIAACDPAAGGRWQWIGEGIEGGAAALPRAPDGVRDFFLAIEQPPEWYDPLIARAGCAAFHANSEMFIGAFVGAVLIEGFATLISKSFAITGRVQDQGVRRLKQNNAHLLEIFLPQGMDRENDGWKLSVRIRLMHARVRALLNRSEEWDREAWGEPLSAAHIGFATAAFSGLLLTRARQLGVRLDAEQTRGFMMIWRYSGHLMGVEPALQVADEAAAVRLHRIGGLCEPPPHLEAILLANTLVNSAPLLLGMSEPAERRKLAVHVYRVSRALIGDALADALRYPPSRSFGVLAGLRLRNFADGLLRRVLPGMEQRRRAGQFQQMLGLSHHQADGLDYRMPALLHAERDRPE